MNTFKVDIDFEIILILLRESLHGRAIAKLLDTSLSSLQNHLSYLESVNILDAKIIGKNKQYSIKKTLYARKYVYNAENYKLLKFLSQNNTLEPLLISIISQTDKMIILFGSYAKFSAKKDSDIDIFVDAENKDLKKELEYLDTRISVKLGGFDVNSLLIKEIIKNHIILQGVESYYDRIGFFK